MDDRFSRRFALLSFVTAGFTYALIVFGGVVRITGSGMGCGDDWPLCNGRLIPPLDLPTLIEYGHRLAAAVDAILVLAVAAYAVRHRRAPGISGRGIVAAAIVAAALLVAEILVGAVTVRLELPTSTVVLHLAVASALLAALLFAGIRARPDAAPGMAERDPGLDYPRWVTAAAALGYLVLLLGGLVANTGAAPLCQGFPLCNGRAFPEGGGLVYLHWFHRLLGFALLALIAVAAASALRQGAPAAVSGSALLALGLVVAQIGVAAALVLLHLPGALRGLHLALGVALWATLAASAILALPPHSRRTAASSP